MESTNTKTLGEVNTINCVTNENGKVESAGKGPTIEIHNEVRNNVNEIVGRDCLVIAVVTPRAVEMMADIAEEKKATISRD